MTDLDAARRFVQEHARLIDRRRFAVHFEGAGPDSVRSALAAYANADGGYAGLIEPDTRTLASQPLAAFTVLEILAEIGAPAEPAMLDWLAAISDPDGGLPFSLDTVADAPHAPWMAPSPGSSLHMTAAVAGAAARAGVTGPWIDGAVAFCRERATGSLTAYETMFLVRLFDALGDDAALDALPVPADGRLPVSGGVEGEALTPLDLAPRPDSRARRLFPSEQIERELDELAAGQRDDGGWDFDWLKWSPVVTNEWRGRRTVDCLVQLRENGR